MTRACNKFGVPYHGYTLTLADGRRKEMDVAWEEYWGEVQPCLPQDCDDWEKTIGWGNDADGHVKIVAVTDQETGAALDPRQWAEELVWCWVECYSQ